MPTYEYRCPKGHTFDVFQKMSDPPRADCPECGSAAERIISAGAGFVFKGSGFYITDYRSEDYKQRARTENPGADPAKKDAAGTGSSGESGEGAKSKPKSEKAVESKPAQKPSGGGEST